MKRLTLVLLFAAGVFATAVSVFVAPKEARRSISEIEPLGSDSPAPEAPPRAEILVERHVARIPASSERAAIDFARRLKVAIGSAVRHRSIPRAESDFWALDPHKEWIVDPEGIHFLREFKKLAVERPASFDLAVKLVGRQADGDIARLVEALEALAVEAREARKFVRPLDILGIPRVRGMRREAIARSRQSRLPASPWIDGMGATGAWDVGGAERGDSLLFDDGSVRRGSQGLWQLNFRDEASRFITWSWRQACSEELLWKLAIFARWGLERGEFEVACDCLLRAREIGAHRWPGEDADALGTRAAREGMKNLADSPNSMRRIQESIAVMLLAGPAPLADRGTPLPAPDPLAVREDHINDGWARWGDLEAERLLLLPRPEQAEVALWLTLNWKSKEIEEERISSLLCSADDGKPYSDRPVEWLRSLGWDAVPTLVAHLDDRLPTGSRHREYTVRVGDVCWLALRAFTGLPDPAEFDPSLPWLLATPDSGTFIMDVKSWWARASVTGETARWRQLFRRGSAPAATWLLSHEPRLCLPEAWEQFDPATRRGRIGRMALEQSLAAAPMEKLESLFHESKGEVRDAVGRAIDAQLAGQRR